MQFERRSRWWGLAASAAIHALLAAGLMLASQRRVQQEQPGAVLQVRLLAAAPSPAAAPPAPAPAPPAAGPAQAPSAAVRQDVRYYTPDELDRQLILLRDRSADDGVPVLRAVAMQIFVDQQGRVVSVRFEGEPLPAAEQKRLRAAFMTLEFLPALRHGQAVPARIRIELLPEAAP